MSDPYCPFMGKKGRSWGELDLSGIAGRVASKPRVPPEVESAVLSLADACRAFGVGLDEAKGLLEEAFDSRVSASSPKRIPRR